MTRWCSGLTAEALAKAVTRLAAMLSATIVLIGTAVPAQADDQSSAAASAQPQEPDRRPDFLFGPPRGSVGLRGSWRFARAGSDLFDFVTRQLTIDRSDFNSPGVMADMAIAITPRFDAQFGFEWNKAAMRSEYRDLVDNEFLPIEQSTSLKLVHLTASVRYALSPRGHDISRFAWVPRRVVPYVGAGGGAIFYDFLQTGDFVDFVDLSVFRDVFRSKGWAPSAHALGGVDIKLYRGLYATVEGRYTKAAGKLGTDFVDFDPIDLSGFRLSGGINLLF